MNDSFSNANFIDLLLPVNIKNKNYAQFINMRTA